jgi:hypothetical protein
MKIIATVLFLSFYLVGCSGINGTMNATQSMPGKMDDTLNQMKQTNDTVSQEPVAIALQDMLDPQYGVALSPIPFDIMPFAQTFGKYASTDQIIQIVYLWMQKLNERTIGVDTPTADQIAAFTPQQNQTYYALEAICGLLPDAKVQQIVLEQITGAGRYQTSATQMLMLRVRFIRDVLINASLLSEPIDNVGKLETGVGYANSIDDIARLPYAASISVDIFGFLPPLAEVKETLNPTSVALGVWSNIKTAVTISATPLVLTGDPVQDKQLYQQQLVRQNTAMATVNAKIKSWGGTP